MVYRAWCRAREDGDSVYVVYPDTRLEVEIDGSLVRSPTVTAHRIEAFDAVPYEHFRSQSDNYRAGADVGSQRCHRELPARTLRLDEVDAIVFRQETDAGQRRQLLEALSLLEDRVLVYLSPKLALQARFGSKVLPAQIAPERVPQSFDTASCSDEQDKVHDALAFIRKDLNCPATVIAKPRLGDNGVGITALGQCPVDRTTRRDPESTLRDMIELYGDVVIQEYIPSVRAPPELDALKQVSPNRHDFGEIRFILIDGTVPRTRDGRRIAVARRVPTSDSLVADSGISYPTRLSPAELAFLDHVGRYYLALGIFFGGGDLHSHPRPRSSVYIHRRGSLDLWPCGGDGRAQWGSVPHR